MEEDRDLKTDEELLAKYANLSDIEIKTRLEVLDSVISRLSDYKEILLPSGIV